jgi:lactate dehydrogenase-like 2-hydroxyacid dehydrogenase
MEADNGLMSNSYVSIVLLSDFQNFQIIIFQQKIFRMYNIAIVNSSIFEKANKAHIKTLSRQFNITQYEFNASSQDNRIIEALREVHCVILGVNPVFNAKILRSLKQLKLIARHGIGLDNVDLVVAEELGIKVTKVEHEIERHSVAEHAVLLILAALRKIEEAVNLAKTDWNGRNNLIGRELFESTVGIIGVGSIGTRVGEILKHGFHCKILACDTNCSSEEIRSKGFTPADLEMVLTHSDIISLHCDLNSGSKKLLDKAKLQKLHSSCVLVNTARGDVVDEESLFEILSQNQISCYATDVMQGEPNILHKKLLNLRNFLVTPHIAAYTNRSLEGMGESVVRSVIEFFK